MTHNVMFNQMMAANHHQQGDYGALNGAICSIQRQPSSLCITGGLS